MTLVRIMKKQFYIIKTLDFLSIFLLTILSIYFLSQNVFIGEIYLNYSDGFIRRGLLGTLIYLFDLNFNLDPYLFSSVINFLTKLILLIIVIYYSIKFSIPKYLVFSYPIFFSGIINSNGRLDSILVLLFILSLSLLKSNSKLKSYYFIIISILGILIHEVYYFMILVPSITLYFLKKEKTYLFNVLLSTIIFLIIILFYKGNSTQATNILYNWSSLNFEPNFKYVFRDLVSNSTFYITDAIKTKKQFVGFFFNNLICILFIIFSYFTSEHNYNKRLNFITIVLSQNLIFIFLCLIAVDYSRWYFILFTSIICFYYLFASDIATKFSLYPYKTNSIKVNNSLFLIATIILYFIISIPFAGWEFNQYFNSHLYFKVKQIFENI